MPLSCVGAQAIGVPIATVWYQIGRRVVVTLVVVVVEKAYVAVPQSVTSVTYVLTVVTVVLPTKPVQMVVVQAVRVATKAANVVAVR